MCGFSSAGVFRVIYSDNLRDECIPEEEEEEGGGGLFISVSFGLSVLASLSPSSSL